MECLLMLWPNAAFAKPSGQRPTKQQPVVGLGTQSSREAFISCSAWTEVDGCSIIFVQDYNISFDTRLNQHKPTSLYQWLLGGWFVNSTTSLLCNVMSSSNNNNRCFTCRRTAVNPSHCHHLSISLPLYSVSSFHLLNAPNQEENHWTLRNTWPAVSLSLALSHSNTHTQLAVLSDFSNLSICQ